MSVNNEGAYDFESIVVGTTAVRLDKTKRSKAHRITLSLETAQIYYRYDALDPTGNPDDGHIMDVGEKMTLEGKTNVENFRAIASGSTAGVLKVTYEGI